MKEREAEIERSMREQGLSREEASRMVRARHRLGIHIPEATLIQEVRVEPIEELDLSPSSSADAKCDLSPTSDDIALADMTESERRHYTITRMATRDAILEAEPERRSAKPTYGARKDGSYWLRAIDETGRLIRELDRAVWFGDAQAGSPDADPFFRDELPKLDRWGKGFDVPKKWERFVPDHLLRRQWWYKRDDGLPYVSFKVPGQGGSRLFVTLKDRAHKDIAKAARSLGASDEVIERIHSAVLGDKCAVCIRERAIRKRYDELVSDLERSDRDLGIGRGRMWVNGVRVLTDAEKAKLMAEATAEIDAVLTPAVGGRYEEVGLTKVG